MDKSNQFKSSSFFMSEGDILHMIIIDETGVPLTVDLQTTPAPGEVINVEPGRVVAKDATAITSSSFTANWNFIENATGYYLDVATNSTFTSYVSGWQNKDMLNTISDSIIGLDPNYIYYYRVRAYNDIDHGIDSETITTQILVLVASDWFLPSKDELNAMYTELYLQGVGGMGGVTYWSSSEYDKDFAWLQRFNTGIQYYGAPGYFKGNGLNVRACRSFVSTTPYLLKDVGQAGGLIFAIDGTTYYEAAPTDQTIIGLTTKPYSSIDSVAIGVTAQGTAIGTGQANTTAIIAQHGIGGDSAAKLCDDLIL